MPTPHCSIAPAVRKPQQSTPTAFLLLALCLLTAWASPALAQPAPGQSALEALAELADKAAAPLASTSPACLSRCLDQCPDTPNRNATQTGERTACLRICLSGCRVRCGTVDTACALDWLGKNRGAAPMGSSLAAACAQACVVKPNCPPPPPRSEIILLTPLAQDAAPDQGAGSAPSLAPGKDEKLFRPGDGSFSLLVPKGWEVNESGTQGQGRAKGDGYELRLTLPGAAGLDYVLFSLRRVSAPHKTAERFLHDLQHPRFGGAGQQAVLGSASLPGLCALPLPQVEARFQRTLIGFPDPVPIVARTVVIKQPLGYFALASELPVALEQRYGPALERLRQSVRLAGVQQARPAAVSPEVSPAVTPEVSTEEYAVYAAFLASDGVPGTDQTDQADQTGGAQASPGAEVVPYLRETARSRTLFSVTVAGPELTPKFETVLFKACGAGLPNRLPEGLAQDYARKRGQQAVVTDRLLVPGLSVRDARDAGQREFFLRDSGPGARPDAGPSDGARQGRMAQPELMAQPKPIGRLSRHSFGDPLSVSRVAFSRDGQTALFYVRKLATSPGTTHFVLMRLHEGRWVLSCALMDELRIY